MMNRVFLILAIVTTIEVQAEETSGSNQNVKYKAGKDVNFEELLIRGEIKRPEMSVVTGNVQQGTDGLLRLRDRFTDRLTMDAGEDL